MLDCDQFREVIIRPTLQALQLYTPVAEELLVATAAHESLGGTYLKQVTGPALGLYQMEPATHDDIWAKFLPSHYDISYKLMNICKMSTKPIAEMMVYNLFYATCMARVFYLRCPQALPQDSDVGSLWEYYKKWWNTEKGKAEKDDFVKAYAKFTGKDEHKGKKK